MLNGHCFDVLLVTEMGWFGFWVRQPDVRDSLLDCGWDLILAKNGAAALIELLCTFAGSNGFCDCLVFGPKIAADGCCLRWATIRIAGHCSSGQI
ncbi:hypothetical protein ACLOJK_036413 [Asimina triloba]